MKTLFNSIVIAAVIGGVIVGGNYGIRRFTESGELAIYHKLHAVTPGTYYQVNDIGSPAQDGGKQFLSVTELVTVVTSNPKTGDTIIEFHQTGKTRQIEVPTIFVGPKSIGSIVVVKDGKTQYLIDNHEAVKNLIGVRNEKP